MHRGPHERRAAPANVQLDARVDVALSPPEVMPSDAATRDRETGLEVQQIDGAQHPGRSRVVAGTANQRVPRGRRLRDVVTRDRERLALLGDVALNGAPVVAELVDDEPLRLPAGPARTRRCLA